MVECILFDNDGTLVDSEHLCFRALSIKFAELGVSLDEGELLIRYRGWKLETTLKSLAEEHGKILAPDFIPAYRALVAELFSLDLQLIPGVEEMLAQLCQARAVVSSGPPAKINQALSVTGIAHHFEGSIYSSYEIGIWKPDPGIYQYAARDMGFSVDQCVVIDDSPVGVEAGVRGGFRTFFLNRFGETCDLPGVTSITKMSEFAALL